MPAAWDRIRDKCARTLSTPTTSRWFERLKGIDPRFTPFDAINDLVRFLHDRDADRDDAYELLTRVLTLARTSRAEADISFSLLWIALGPGLDAIFKRAARRCADLEALATEISSRFVLVLHQIPLGPGTRPTANLLRSTERALLDDERRRGREFLQCTDFDIDFLPSTHADPQTRLDAKRALAAAAFQIGGDEAGLFDVLTESCTAREYAAECGVSRACFQSRWRRVAAQYREKNEKSDTASDNDRADEPPLAGEGEMPEGGSK